MGFFSQKQKVNLEDFCQNFYYKTYLNPTIGNVTVNDFDEAMYGTVLKAIIESDNNFSKVDLKKFKDEYNILQFELFALAWLHQFGDKSAIDQSAFTRNYLSKCGRLDIWDNAEDYNQSIARATEAVIKSNEALVICANKNRIDMFEELHKKFDDVKIIARPLNRFFFEGAWKKNITPYFLMFQLCDRLGFKNIKFEDGDDINKKAQENLTFIIRSIYDGAKYSMKDITIKS